MKKIMIMLVVAAAVVSAKAAMVDWKVAGTDKQTGMTVYLLTSLSDFADKDALVAAAVSSATITGAGRGKYATPETTAIGDTVTKDASFYYAIVTSDKEYVTYDVSILRNSVYDTSKQETSPGVYEGVDANTILAGNARGFGGSDPVVPTPTPIDPSGVPEPTSGLLLLVGGAALALRRKQK